MAVTESTTSYNVSEDFSYFQDLDGSGFYQDSEDFSYYQNSESYGSYNQAETNSWVLDSTDWDDNGIWIKNEFWKD